MPFVRCTSIAPCKSPAILVWGLSCAGFITGCRIESEERAEPCDRETLGQPLARTVNYISSIILWVLTVSASSLGSASTWSLGELCPGCGMPCSSYLQEPWELKWKVNAASSARVLCQQFKDSYCIGFQMSVFQMEVQGFSVSVFSLLRLNLRKESICLWAVALRSSPLCQSKFGSAWGDVLAG